MSDTEHVQHDIITERIKAVIQHNNYWNSLPDAIEGNTSHMRNTCARFHGKLHFSHI